MELLLVRHARPLRAESFDGPADPGLSPLGRRQADALAAWLAPEVIDAIYTSPLRRALETAAPLAIALGVDPVPEPALAEYDADAMAYIPIEELKAAGDPRWNELPEQPEHFRRVVVDAIEAIVTAHPGHRVAVVCHGGVINAYAAHVLGIDDALFFLPTYTSISRVFAASTGERSIASLNEAAHLRDL